MNYKPNFKTVQLVDCTSNFHPIHILKKDEKSLCKMVNKRDKKEGDIFETIKVISDVTCKVCLELQYRNMESEIYTLTNKIKNMKGEIESE